MAYSICNVKKRATVSYLISSMELRPLNHHLTPIKTLARA